ncbi:hypothetical protein BVG16_12665 [Paenibacillus selenitireducens]|uniref:Uncharacterized protein n=1 Tax=Paenibacillus selenitireducens TaxID=1324314 RepID=A0A1T2XFW0_9BACL|nr:hypothetical protein [Paenibacillus selenitireducens]OPA78702.1 hypothetical protein BVG16_12665 [Paenibacillus selenitireducens]
MKKSRITLVVLIIFLITGIGYMNGYRFNALSAAKANSFVPKDSILIDEVDYSWGRFYIFDSPEKPVTAITLQSYRFLWSSRMSVYHYHRDDRIITIGGGTLNNPKEKATVISIIVDDPDVSYLEVGPESNRVKRGVNLGKPMTFAWDVAVQLNFLYPKAFNKNGELLYEYRYPKTNYIRQEDLRWYSVKESSLS